MIRLERAGVSTRLHSTLCGQCPHGPTGCCASPPGVDWSDIGRIATLGGGEWLLEQMGAGRLRPGPRGLLLQRVPNPDANAGIWPTKCVYHGPRGCTIEPDLRAATCNYYICDDAFLFGGESQGDPDAVAGREVHATLMALYGRWDLEIMQTVQERWPGGPTWNAAFLDWVAGEFRRLARRDRRDWRSISGRPGDAPR